MSNIFFGLFILQNTGLRQGSQTAGQPGPGSNIPARATVFNHEILLTEALKQLDTQGLTGKNPNSMMNRAYSSVIPNIDNQAAAAATTNAVTNLQPKTEQLLIQLISEPHSNQVDKQVAVALSVSQNLKIDEGTQTALRSLLRQDIGKFTAFTQSLAEQDKQNNLFKSELAKATTEEQKESLKMQYLDGTQKRLQIMDQALKTVPTPEGHRYADTLAIGRQRTPQQQQQSGSAGNTPRGQVVTINVPNPDIVGAQQGVSMEKNLEALSEHMYKAAKKGDLKDPNGNKTVDRLEEFKGLVAKNRQAVTSNLSRLDANGAADFQTLMNESNEIVNRAKSDKSHRMTPEDNAALKANLEEMESYMNGEQSLSPTVAQEVNTTQIRRQTRAMRNGNIQKGVEMRGTILASRNEAYKDPQTQDNITQTEQLGWERKRTLGETRVISAQYSKGNAIYRADRNGIPTDGDFDGDIDPAGQRILRGAVTTTERNGQTFFDRLQKRAANRLIRKLTDW